MEIGIYTHHPSPWVTESDITLYTSLLHSLLPHILAEPEGPDSSQLPSLEEVEISLVDDLTIADVHQNFMNIPGATDVITFQHGELIISLDTAISQATEFQEKREKELFRYMTHGLLHLHGYLDYESEDRKTMLDLQEKLISLIWEDTHSRTHTDVS